MASTFRTVGDEVSLTNWSTPVDAPRSGAVPSRRSNLLNIVTVAVIGVAVVFGLFHLLPAGSY